MNKYKSCICTTSVSEFRVGCLLSRGGSWFWFSQLKNAMYTTTVLGWGWGDSVQGYKGILVLQMLGTSCPISRAWQTLSTRLYWHIPRHTTNFYASGPLHSLCPLPAISPSLQIPNTSQRTPRSTAPHLQGCPLLRPFLVPSSQLVTHRGAHRLLYSPIRVHVMLLLASAPHGLEPH